MNPKIVKLTVEFDAFAENPCDCDGWKLYSFNTRHTNFRDPYSFFSHVDQDGTVTTKNIGLNRKLNAGTAFVVSYAEHGLCSWSLLGEGQQYQWDSTRVAGILMWEQGTDNLCYKAYKNEDAIRRAVLRYRDRQKDARNFLDWYTNWCNGENYNGVVEYEDGETQSVGGYTGVDNLKAALKEEFPEIFIEGTIREDIEIDGEAKGILS